MIDDQQVGIPDPPPGCEVKALLVCGAFFAKTVAVITQDFIPDIRFGLKRQIRSSAVRCRVSPLPDFGQRNQ